MQKTKLAIMFGGQSSEYGVSLHSVYSVLNNIDYSKYEVHKFGISREGELLYYNGDNSKIDNNTWMEDASVKNATIALSSSKKGFYLLDGNNTFIDIDVVFPVMHGKFGEDGTLQGLLEMAHLPYVGCNTLSSSVAMDKEFTHIICEDKGIQMAKFETVYEQSATLSEEEFNNYATSLGLPIFIKPANAGSSYGISKIKNYEEYKNGLVEAFKHDEKVLLEQAISGFEVGVAVLGNSEIKMGEIDEIETHRDFFDFEGKYAMSDSKIHCPARISDELKANIYQQAEVIYKTLGCKGFSRIDFFVTTEQEIYFNELNTIPGFTANSRYPSMMAKVGVNFTQLIDKLIELALN